MTAGAMTVGAGMTAKKRATTKSKKGTVNYTSDEVKDLLLVVAKVLPAGNEDWSVVGKFHSEKYPNHDRDWKSLKSKFNDHANKKPKTGNPEKVICDVRSYIWNIKNSQVLRIM